MIISRTPLRLSFFGGGTDYPQHYLKHGGQVLGCTFNKYAYVVCHSGSVSHFFDLPNKSGLASSSAYTVGLLRACCDFDNLTIAKLATTWEFDKTGGQVGSQDQYLCAMGGFRHIKFSEHGIRDIPLKPEWYEPLEPYLMLFDTHQYRRNGDVIPQQLARLEDNEKTLIRMAGMVDEGVSLLKSGQIPQFGQLLGESWQLKRSLAESVSTPLVDDIYARAVDAGAVGGKLLGGGGGGFIIFVVEPEKQAQVKEALGDLTFVPFHFETVGSQVIYRDA